MAANKADSPSTSAEGIDKRNRISNSRQRDDDDARRKRKRKRSQLLLTLSNCYRIIFVVEWNKVRWEIRDEGAVLGLFDRSSTISHSVLMQRPSYILRRLRKSRWKRLLGVEKVVRPIYKKKVFEKKAISYRFGYGCGGTFSHLLIFFWSFAFFSHWEECITRAAWNFPYLLLTL